MIFLADVYVQKEVSGAALKWLYLVRLVGLHLWTPRQNTSEASSNKCLFGEIISHFTWLSYIIAFTISNSDNRDEPPVLDDE